MDRNDKSNIKLTNWQFQGKNSSPKAVLSMQSLAIWHSILVIRQKCALAVTPTTMTTTAVLISQ